MRVIADHDKQAATTTILKKKQHVIIPASSFEQQEQKFDREASKQAIEFKKVDHRFRRSSQRSEAAQLHLANVNSRIEETKENILNQDTRNYLNASQYARVALADSDL